MTDFEIKQVHTNDFQMNYAKIGNGNQVLVMLPGVSLKPVTPMAALLSSAFDTFKKTHSIYLFDRRILSSDQPYSIMDMADDQIQVLQALKIDKADFFCCSQGGMIALSIALRKPDIVNKLVLASTACRIDSSSKTILYKWKKLTESGDMPALAEQMIEDIYAEKTIHDAKDALMAGFENVSKSQIMQFIVMVNAILNFNVKAQLNAIKTKTFIVGCEGDKIFGASSSREMAEILKCDAFIYDQTYGHAVYDEAPDFRQKVLDFLTD